MIKKYTFNPSVGQVLSCLKGVRQGRKGWMALCPAHNDNNPSLSISTCNGKVLLRCFAGCSVKDIIAALGLSSYSESYSERSSSFPKQPLTLTSLAQAKGLPEEFLRPFVLENGRGLTFYYRLPDGQMNCRQRLRTALKARDGSSWTGEGDIVPYGLWKLKEFLEEFSSQENPETPYLLLVEGETDTLTLWYHGVPALGIPGASMAGKLKSEYLEGFEILYLCQEPDKGGESFVRGVLRQVTDWNWKGTAKIIRFSKEIKDVNGLLLDCQQKGVDFNVALRQAISEAIEVDKCEASIEVREPDWSDPVLLPGTHPVPRFSVELLPVEFRDWAVDLSTSQGFPIEFLAVGVIVAAGAAVGNQRTIRPKRKDTWTVVPNQWGMVVGPPGSMKTAALQEALRPLYCLEKAEIERYKALKTEWEKEEELRSLQRKALEDEIRRASMAGKDVATLVAKMQALKTVPPTCKRYIVNDITVEKLGVLLSQNPNGLLLCRDELSGLLRTLEKRGHEADRAFFLEAWNGDGHFTYDRIGRGTIVINNTTLSILGGIQPELLKAILKRSSLEEEMLGEGWLQRFQLLVYPDQTEWQLVDREPNAVARERVTAIFEKLVTLGANGVRGSLHFDSSAQEYFYQWISEWENSLRREGDSYLKSHLVKYRSLMPSLALLFHLIDSESTSVFSEVSMAAVQRAAAWCEFLRKHAVKFYGFLSQHTIPRSVESLAARLLNGDLPNPFSGRDVLRHNWASLTSPRDRDYALAFLEDLAWIRSEKILTGGRPSIRYLINPKLRRQR